MYDLLLNNIFLLRDPELFFKYKNPTYWFSNECFENYTKVLRKKYISDIPIIKSKINAYSKNMDMITSSDQHVINDMLYSKYVLGFHYWEYLTYQFYHKSFEERLEYFSQHSRKLIFSLLNPDNKARAILNDKYQSWVAFKDLYKRELLLVNNKNDLKKINYFLKSHPACILKPRFGSCGKGIKIINYSLFENDAFEAKLEYPFVLEELIEQNDSLKQFHSKSVNCIRIFTYHYKNIFKILYPTFKCGQNNSIIDNISEGGLTAVIDKKNGTITTSATNLNGKNYEFHPNTHIAFKEFHIPFWEEIPSLLYKAVKRIPKISFVGWDLALTKENEWVIVEGNTQPMINLYQIPKQRGILRDFANETQLEERIANVKVNSSL